ncbi:hypothetical protein [Phytohabitans kaempferiae]|uniref:Uncharacterized protein n=1 Tax=Phytohabitans kaempferiae TaxID=1620943 RepID=A0ABV6M3B2_9ACTN
MNAAPAAADQGIGTSFGSPDGTVWGRVTFYDTGYTVKVEGSVYG